MIIPPKSVLVAVLVTLVMTACGGGDTASPQGQGQGQGQGGPLLVDASNFDNTALGVALAALPLDTLSEAEKATLAYMREEEKLAHDVYALSATLWGSTKIFGNIAISESTHTEALRQLLVRYTLTDPAATTAPGIFQDTTLQALYTQLAAASALSMVDALKVGATIEEVDMIDINKALLEVDNQDIRLVYENLLKGSRNHLRSFVNTLLAQGVTYEPKFMTLADYTAIVSTPMER
jgi:hypothetical protein